MRALLSLAGLAAVLLLAAPARAEGDAAAGEKLFKIQCGACHSPLEGKRLVGPSLFGVVGRHSGSVPGYPYSAANKKANLTWDEATLDKYIENPKAVVPGTIMTYVGLKDAAKRADVIAYLKTLH